MIVNTQTRIASNPVEPKWHHIKRSCNFRLYNSRRRNFLCTKSRKSLKQPYRYAEHNNCPELPMKLVIVTLVRISVDVGSFDAINSELPWPLMITPLRTPVEPAIVRYVFGNKFLAMMLFETT